MKNFPTEVSLFMKQHGALGMVSEVSNLDLKFHFKN